MNCFLKEKFFFKFCVFVCLLVFGNVALDIHFKKEMETVDKQPKI